MTSLLIKICGLSTPETVAAALDAGSDMVGFVFFPPSPRNLSPDLARDLAARVEGRAQKVSLTVDADDATLDRIMRVAVLPKPGEKMRALSSVESGGGQAANARSRLAAVAWQGKSAARRRAAFPLWQARHEGHRPVGARRPRQGLSL